MVTMRPHHAWDGNGDGGRTKKGDAKRHVEMHCPQGLLEMESVAGTQVPKSGKMVGYCMPSTFINLFSLLGTYFCPSSCSQTHSRLT